MGVCGSGKTLIGRAFADALGVQFVEGDEYHPPANVEKMSRGQPLTDEDRAGWLDALAARIAASRRPIVLTCSALKRAYRDRLRQAGDIQFIYLRGSRQLIASRLADRKDHFMPASLLDSQLATLEEPAADEGAWVVDIDQDPKVILRGLLER
jgi:gluconokinase